MLRFVGIWLETVASAALLSVGLSLAVDAAYGCFAAHTLLIWLLPLCGVVTYGLYRILKLPYSTGTAQMVKDLSEGRAPSPKLAPAIFAGTCLTILAGGSVGKEAAALQLGAGMASLFARKGGGKPGFGASDALLPKCAMAAALSALLGAPLASAIFVVELFAREKQGPRAFAIDLVFIVLAAGLGFLLACLAPVDRAGLRRALLPPGLGDTPLFVLIAVLGAAAGMLFCVMLGGLSRLWGKCKVNPVILLMLAGLLYAAVVSFGGAYDLAGTGMNYVTRALDGSVDTPFFLGKILATALLLSCGFKGGEIMPVLCIGATLGCFAGQLLGIDATFAAAIGLVAVFSACTKCPIAAVLLACESFGIAGAPWFLAASAIAWLASPRLGLYGNVRKPLL